MIRAALLPIASLLATAAAVPAPTAAAPVASGARCGQAVARTAVPASRCARPIAGVARRDAARPSVAWRAPSVGGRVASDRLGPACRATASDDVRVDRVVFSVDGRRLNTETRAPYNCYWYASRAKPGPHRITAKAIDTAGRSSRATIVVNVTKPAAPSPTPDPVLTESTSAPSATVAPETLPANPAPAPSAPAPAAPSKPVTRPAPLASAAQSDAQWSDSFETGNFSAWSWWGLGDSSYASLDVVDPARAGIPARDGSKVARFETTPGDIAAGRLHAKVYRGFGSKVGSPDSKSPADVSGTYSASYFLPEDYKVPAGTWVNLFQFKEKFRTAGGDSSDPSWWLQLSDRNWAQDMASAYGTPVPQAGRADAPVLFVNRWGNDWKVKRNFVALPLGRWFELKAVVREGEKIDFYLDGELFQTVTQSEMAIGPTRGADSMEWIFGVGNYSTGANGPMYADRAAFSAA